MADERARQQRLDAYRESLAGRATFQELDDRATAAAVELVKARARLAKERPEEFFGLRPTERERFLAEDIRSFMGSGDGGGGDVTGSNPVIARLAPFILDFLLDRLLGGGDGEGILDKGMEFIEKEKEYWLQGDNITAEAMKQP